jgi:DNA-binding GntR family transcriptional regulator
MFEPICRNTAILVYQTELQEQQRPSEKAHTKMVRNGSAGEAMAVAFDRQQSVPRQVYELLRAKILSVELRPGESINERRLSEWLGVSRTPVREAIKRLSDNGLISTIPNVGTFVSLINPKKVEELYLIRTSLETASIRLAAEGFDRKKAHILQTLIDQQRATLQGPDLPTNIAIDNEFHRSIAEFSGLTTTWSILEQVMGEILRVRHLSVRMPRRLEEPIREHVAILRALKTGNPDSAEQAMKRHLAASHDSVVMALAQNPSYLSAAEGTFGRTGGAIAGRFWGS